MTLILILVLITSIRLSWWGIKVLGRVLGFFICLGGYAILGALALGVLSISFAGPLIGIAFLASLIAPRRYIE